VTAISTQYQNHSTVNIFSFITLSAITQRAVNGNYKNLMESHEWAEHVNHDSDCNRKLTVMLLYRARRSILVEMTFGHFREDHIERVHDSVEVISKHIDAQGQEPSAEEDVSEVNLQHEIDEIENFAEDHFTCPVPIHLDVLEEGRLDSFELKFDTILRSGERTRHRPPVLFTFLSIVGFE
jgi:hypothetical protein